MGSRDLSRLPSLPTISWPKLIVKQNSSALYRRSRSCGCDAELKLRLESRPGLQRQVLVPGSGPTSDHRLVDHDFPIVQFLLLRNIWTVQLEPFLFLHTLVRGYSSLISVVYRFVGCAEQALRLPKVISQIQAANEDLFQQVSVIGILFCIEASMDRLQSILSGSGSRISQILQ